MIYFNESELSLHLKSTLDFKFSVDYFAPIFNEVVFKDGLAKRVENIDIESFPDTADGSLAVFHKLIEEDTTQNYLIFPLVVLDKSVTGILLNLNEYPFFCREYYKDQGLFPFVDFFHRRTILIGDNSKKITYIGSFGDYFHVSSKDFIASKLYQKYKPVVVYQEFYFGDNFLTTGDFSVEYPENTKIDKSVFNFVDQLLGFEIGIKFGRKKYPQIAANISMVAAQFIQEQVKINCNLVLEIKQLG